MTHDIGDIEERWAKAELAPWRILNPENVQFRYPFHIVGEKDDMDALDVGAVYFRHNATAIASAPSDIAQLVARVRELEAMLRRDAELLIEGKGLVEEYTALCDRYREALEGMAELWNASDCHGSAIEALGVTPEVFFEYMAP